MYSSCEIVQRDVTRSIVVRTRCGVEQLPSVLGETYQNIAVFLGSKGVEPTGPPFVAYHNEDMQDLDLEIGFPVADDLQAEGEFENSSIPAGRYVSSMHTGPYSKVSEAYEQIVSWMDGQSIQPTGSCYEIYLNDPANTPEEGLQTLILFPIQS